MDDCSPDNTPEVAMSFKDSRVRYIRNEPNLGHLSNYNKGIEMSRGAFVWLISADDRLRRTYAVERYVALMEPNPSLGYVFCSAMRLEDGSETEMIDYSIHGDRDFILNGHEFLKRLVNENTIVAPTVMVRKSCYECISMFPLNMPWGGDWYLWFVFALHRDVAYVNDALVCYRRHPGSMTNLLTTEAVDRCSIEDIEMRWVMKKHLDTANLRGLSKLCLRSAAEEYARNIATKDYRTATAVSISRMTVNEFEQSLAEHCPNPSDRRFVEARVYSHLADRLRWDGSIASARTLYLRALAHDPFMTKTWLNLVFTFGGNRAMQLKNRLVSFARPVISRRTSSA
jgi:hypothetical protein